MKVSLNWIRDYVDISMGTDDLVELLTMGGLEVEGVTTTGQGFEKVVVAELETIRKHPNAEKLSLVQARTDRGRFSIVCGAKNIREGQKVPLALVGARLPNGVEIRRTKIRGEVSEGMLCSETELGLGKDASGIMILPGDFPLGANLGELLGLRDTVLDISVTPNRPDCLSVIGVAREIAALTHQQLRYPRIVLSEDGEEIGHRTSVTVLDPDLCPRYVARLIDGVKIGPSPVWMSTRLEKVGLRSINNVVDVTNYVMMEYGQPLHAFDFELLEEGRIVVRRAVEGEEFVTLDGVKRTLDQEMLMICDGVKPVAIAGVMGGLNSEIREETKVVLLESAYFSPAGNRRTAKKLGLETEAAYRFGRGVDYGGCVAAANRATQLIQELAGGKVLKGVIDVYPAPIQPKPISLSLKKVRQVLGTEVSGQEVAAHLKGLELKVEEEGEDLLRVVPPSFRGDLEREIDLIEEVARLHGYDKIPTTLPKGPPSADGRNRALLLERKAIDMLIHHGYHEVITYSFTSPVSSDLLCLSADDPRRRHVQILNPLTEDFSVLRTSLLPGLLETARFNISRKNLNLKLFELRKVFHPRPKEKLPEEVKYLAGIALGLDREPHWSSVPRSVDFYDVKGCIEDLLRILQIKGVKWVRDETIPYLHPGKSSKLLIGGEPVGVIGETHPKVMTSYGLPGRAYIFEINFEQLLKGAVEEKRFRPLPKFPAVFRDLSMVVDEWLEVEKVTEAIWALQQPFVDEVHLFDVYRGAPIPEGKKSISYRIRYQAPDRTLTDEEVNRHHEKIIFRLMEIFKAELRQ